SQTLQEGPLSVRGAGVPELRALQQLAKFAGARVLVHGVLSGRAHAIHQLGPYARDRIDDAAKALQELRAAAALRQELAITSPVFAGRQARQITSPLRVVDADLPLGTRGASRQAARIRQPAMAHERRDPHLAVVGAADLMPDAGV